MEDSIRKQTVSDRDEYRPLKWGEDVYGTA